MQKDITKYLNTDPVLTLESQVQWFENLNSKPYFYNWIIQVDNKDVGVVQIVAMNEEQTTCEWGYYVAQKEARSLALAVSVELSLYDYIFTQTKMQSITCETFTKNASVVKIHELCGLNMVTVYKDHVHKNGKSFDVALQEITREKWESQKDSIDYTSIEFEK